MELTSYYEERSGNVVKDGKIFDSRGAYISDYSHRDAVIYLNMALGHDYDSAAAAADHVMTDEERRRVDELTCL